jgi:hypothetical protein
MSRSVRIAAAVAVGGSLVVAAPALAAKPPKKVGTTINIQTGAIGALKPNTPAAKVRSLLGKPNNQDKQGFSGQSSDLAMDYGQYGLQLSFWQGTQGGAPKLSGTTVTSSIYKTKQGVGVGSSLSALQKSTKGVKCYHGSSQYCTFTAGKGTTNFYYSGTTIKKIVLNF